MLQIEQLVPGRDFAAAGSRCAREAASFANFIYLIEEEGSRRCALVDPAWDIAGLLALLDSRELQLEAVLLTHTHADHAGGALGGIQIEGIAELWGRRPVPVLLHPLELPRLRGALGGRATSLKFELVEEGGRRALGRETLSFLHTPGHTPGALSILAGDALLTGDTLFVDECGRVDLEGSDPVAMWHSLQRLAALPGETRVLPGHDYGPEPTSTIARQRQSNPWMKVSLEAWLASLGE